MANAAPRDHAACSQQTESRAKFGLDERAGAHFLVSLHMALVILLKKYLYEVWIAYEEHWGG